MFFIQLATATAVVAAAAAEASTAAAKNKDNDKDNNPRATSVITVIATHKRTSLPFSNSYYEKEVCCVTTKSDANIFVSDYSAVYTENLGGDIFVLREIKDCVCNFLTCSQPA